MKWVGEEKEEGESEGDRMGGERKKKKECLG